jgi:hypothetical protein
MLFFKSKYLTNVKEYLGAIFAADLLPDSSTLT